jgi:hypothetical protein
MIRRVTLATVLLLGACGESDAKTKEDAGDGTADAGRDADAATTPDTGSGGPPVTPDVVTNVGRSCGSAASCEGEKPSCQTALDLLGVEIPFPGGYCSATCADNLECGADGECPIGESLKAVPELFRGLISGFAPSHCYQHCSDDSDCRTDEEYRCVSIVGALNEAAGSAGLDVGGLDVSSFLTGPITDSKYCLPPTPELPDAGPLPMPGQDAAAADAGVADAGMVDAAASDAASSGDP